ncbi:MAG: hypothetical protein ABIH18_08025 [Candidatus Omnitrophota bacterium]
MGKIIKVYFLSIILLIISFLVLDVSFAKQPVNSALPADIHILPGKIKVSIDKETVNIGEKIKFTVIISCPKNIEVDFPALSGKIGEFDIKDSGFKERTFFGKRKINAWYKLESWTTGKLAIPKIEIKYRYKDSQEWQKIETEEQPIEIKSLLDESASGADKDIRDIKDLVYIFPKHLLVIVIIGLILLAGIICMVVLFLLRKIKAKRGIIISKKAHEIAYEQLERLRLQGLVSQGKIKEYYIAISDIIRRYLENRFLLRAPEMTTEEFLVNVRDYSQLKIEHKNLLKEFLLSCDLVKFAKYTPPQQEIDSVFDTAKRFVDQTKEENDTVNAVS